jgi:hypothetical protein
MILDQHGLTLFAMILSRWPDATVGTSSTSEQAKRIHLDLWRADADLEDPELLHGIADGGLEARLAEAGVATAHAQFRTEWKIIAEPTLRQSDLLPVHKAIEANRTFQVCRRCQKAVLSARTGHAILPRGESMMMRMESICFVALIGIAVVCAEDKPALSPAKEPKLRDELIRRVETDQKARNAMIEWQKKHGTGPHEKDLQAEFAKIIDRVKSADEENTKWLGEVIDKHGWPTISLVGKEGAFSAWLLVQHADANPKFQRTCLDLMTKLPKTEINLTNVAYLTDRVLLAEGKKQRFGTQFTNNDGKWEPRPLEDADSVDKRRAEVHLGPIAEYAKELEAMYGPKKK